MERSEAREYFLKIKGLDYRKITPLSIRKLQNSLETELINYYENGGDHAKQMSLRVSKGKVKDVKFENEKLKYACIKIDGSYFKDREGISFNQDGFIGFGGEFSDDNVQPILLAFCKWCDGF